MLGKVEKSWDLDTVFTEGEESKDLSSYVKSLEDDLINTFNRLIKMDTTERDKDIDQLINMIIDIGNLHLRLREIESYSICLLRIDNNNEKSITIKNIYERLNEKFKNVSLKLDLLLKNISDITFKKILENEKISSISLSLNERRIVAKRCLSKEGEYLFQKYAIEGVKSWVNLRNLVINKMKTSVKINGEDHLVTGRKLIHMMFTSHPDVQLRKSLPIKFQEQVKGNEELIAWAFNQIINTNKIAHEVRGYKKPFEQSLVSNRISGSSLQIMGETLEKNLHRFVPYFNRKAQLLKLNKLSEEDLLAPLVMSNITLPYERGLELIINGLGNFSNDMKRFVYKAIRDRWIDVRDSSGKSFIQFACFMPISRQSRISTIYSDDYQSVAVLAHELGHAYHDYELSMKSAHSQIIPLSMAEIASTFTENIVTSGYLKEVKSKEEKITVLDEKIKNTILFMLKPYVNYLFLKSVYENNKSQYLSSSELDNMMVQAQKFVYQDSLSGYNEKEWISNNLFWLTDRPFYNYQYTFGTIFSSGLYSLMSKGLLTSSDYINLLQDTGSLTIENLSIKHLSVDLKEEYFWQQSLEVILSDINEFIQLTDNLDSF